MSIFEPVHAFFRRRAVKTLNEAAACVYLVNRRQESPRGNFVFPGTDYLDDIEVGGHRVGHVDYGINPLGDRLYINMLEIEPAQQGQGMGMAVLWLLWRTHQVPIVPLYQYTSSDGFWDRARRRFAAAGAVIGGMLLGLIESIGSGYLGTLTGGVLGSNYTDILAFIVLIVILTLRPSGLLGERVADRA